MDRYKKRENHNNDGKSRPMPQNISLLRMLRIITTHKFINEENFFL